MMEEQTNMVKKGGYMSQRSDDPPRDYIGTSHPNEDPPRGVNSDIKIGGSFESGVYYRTYHYGVATRRDHIYVETGGEIKELKSISWGKVWTVENGNSDVKDVTGTFEL